ncbi:ATP-dependent nuclease [Lentzea albida]|uniref:Putative ATP-dependent endonuclease of the OLD family n=1 Tax=Lentzea albida TaxID=65499 RepID=A0A1H9VCQ8_9PSEU|nr:AAA family ATPase [Lentzea albida]SES19472.1 putative ATP-dependent endonuclease of the OLD family [Lentzea albida]
MRIECIRVTNFRNLADLCVAIQPGTVIVGENRAGKSNLLYALRLVLDPTLSPSDRHLGREDFWDGLSDGSDDWDPMDAREVIEISVDLADFEDDNTVLSTLSDALVQSDPLRARLTYRFAPLDTGVAGPGAKVKYRWTIFGGEDEGNQIDADLRGYLYFAFLGALRDVDADLSTWRRSPLRVLLTAAAKAIGDDDLSRVRSAMREANAQLNDLAEIKRVGTSISDRMMEILGANQALETELAVAAEDPLRLIRTMKLFVDGAARRHLSTTSLGTLNVLYLALLELGLEERLAEQDIAHVVMTIEEPEAHLHPHMQRLAFRRLLADHRTNRSILVTTHSPHIASVASPRSLVVLRDAGGRTEAAAASDAALTDAEWDDIARYLDATRAELVFARRVLLVEGYAEQALLPSMAAAVGMDLDKLGITVCVVHGTHFTSYARFCEALGIRWAVITDGDGDAGPARAGRLLAALSLNGDPGEHGIFVGTSTFEYDLLYAHPSNVKPCFGTLWELSADRARATMETWVSQWPEIGTYLTTIDKAGGKGRFAQRLASQQIWPPDYVHSALRYLAG